MGDSNGQDKGNDSKRNNDSTHREIMLVRSCSSENSMRPLRRDTADRLHRPE